MPRQDPAVECRSRPLRQGARAVPGLEHGGDAGGPEQRVEIWVLREALHGRGVERLPGHRRQIGSDLTRLELGHSAEFDLGHLGEHRREPEGLDFGERGHQLVDRVVLPGEGTVTAAVLGLEPEDGLLLLGRGHGHRVGLPVLVLEIAAVGIEAILGVDQTPMGLEQPGHPIAVAVLLLVGGERQDQVAAGHPALPLPADEVGHQDGDALLDVLGSAAVEIAVLLGELERIESGRPILRPRLHHVEMGDQQNRLPLAAPVDSGNHVLLLGVRAENLDVGRGESGRPEPARHGERRRRRPDPGFRRLDLDQFLEDAPGQGLVVPRRHRTGLCGTWLGDHEEGQGAKRGCASPRDGFCHGVG